VGSFFKPGVGDLTVVTWTTEDRILETPRKIAIQSLFLGLGILSLAIVFVVFFADSLARPIQHLVHATKLISSGDFKARAKPSTRDELRSLGEAFNEMASGLAERERIKDIFGKFHSKAVFSKLLQEDRLRLGGEKIPVTVFFSDIRSFTSKSEKMLPEKVVEMLNEYMTEMVSVIERHDGIVDKYVGDAIMAVWGMPQGNPALDARKAVLACLEMREQLKKLNERRKARGEPPLEIGMGLNSGEVIAGNIGSASRMEYTVIGDTVNTASRMESLTKDFRTDFLIHESTVES
jgi:adenylate cyclase